MKFLCLFLFPFFITSTNEAAQSSTTVSASGKVCFSSGNLSTTNLKIKPNSSESFLQKLEERKTIIVQIAGGDLGSGRIVAEVYDPNGNMIASSGSSRFSFDTKNIKGEYKIVVINKTKEIQKVKVTVNQTDI
jgi:hypothetical protein